MTPAELTAATAMYRTLAVLPCTCSWQFKYNVDKGKQLHDCHRCKAMRAWEAVVLEQAA